jgi:hypothetical protein
MNFVATMTSISKTVKDEALNTLVFSIAEYIVEKLKSK